MLSVPVILPLPVPLNALIVGLVSVLFVSVCDPVSVATVLSIAMLILLSLTVVSIPVPPAIVSVCPVLNESLDPLSAASVKLDVTVAKLSAPLPSVCKNWLALPSAVGNVYALLNCSAPVLVIPSLTPNEVATLVDSVKSLSPSVPSLLQPNDPD